MMGKRVGPTALKVMLADLGLEIVKTNNTEKNLGKTPELLVCEEFEIKPATHRVEWIS